MKVLTVPEAEKEGYQSITNAYFKGEEDRLKADLAGHLSKGVDCVLVKVAVTANSVSQRKGLEIWRRGRGRKKHGYANRAAFDRGGAWAKTNRKRAGC